MKKMLNVDFFKILFDMLYHETSRSFIVLSGPIISVHRKETTWLRFLQGFSPLGILSF